MGGYAEEGGEDAKEKMTSIKAQWNCLELGC